MTKFPLNDAAQWVEAFGAPLYVYDAKTIRGQYFRMKQAFDPSIDVDIHYACKALNNLNILKLMRSLGAGLDAVSLGEIELGLHAGFRPDQILFTPNGVGIHEIKAAVEIGVQINIDNLETLEEFANEFGNSVPVCVRINPHIMAGGNAKISVGHIDSKFGISIHQVRHLHRIVQNMGLHVHGLHMHTGSDILDIDALMRGADLLMDLAHDFKELTYIDFGSGFKVGYKPGESATDIESFGNKMSTRFKEFCLEYGRDLKLIDLAQSRIPKDNFGENIHGNLFEALIGAIFLDKGYKYCEKFIHYRVISPYVDIERLEGKVISYKSLLIEWCQKEKKSFKFDVYEDTGNDELKHFAVKLYIDNRVAGKARATSKKKAEEKASKRAYFAFQKQISQ